MAQQQGADSQGSRSSFRDDAAHRFRDDLARGDGRYARIQRALGGVELLILDDWGLEHLDAAARHDLLEILEERYGRRSTIITSQIPKWHELIGESSRIDNRCTRRASKSGYAIEV